MEDYPPEMQHFVEQEGIQVFHYRTEGNKEPFVEVNPEDITHALVKLLDKRCHPVLIHCLKGKVSDTHSVYDKHQTDPKVNVKHRIGCLVGCLRKIQNWSMTSIFDEYRKFAGTKVLADQEVMDTDLFHLYSPLFSLLKCLIVIKYPMILLINLLGYKTNSIDDTPSLSSFSSFSPFENHVDEWLIHTVKGCQTCLIYIILLY